MSSIIAGNLREHPPPDLDDLEAQFWLEWKDRTEDSAEVRFSKRESDTDAVQQLARRMLSSFLESPHRHTDGVIIGIEERMSAKVLEGCRPLLGIVDLVFQSDDRLVVRDYKTAGRKWNQGNAESNAGQQNFVPRGWLTWMSICC